VQLGRALLSGTHQHHSNRWWAEAAVTKGYTERARELPPRGADTTPKMEI